MHGLWWNAIFAIATQICARDVLNCREACTEPIAVNMIDHDCAKTMEDKLVDRLLDNWVGSAFKMRSFVHVKLHTTTFGEPSRLAISRSRASAAACYQLQFRWKGTLGHQMRHVQRLQTSKQEWQTINADPRLPDARYRLLRLHPVKPLAAWDSLGHVHHPSLSGPSHLFLGRRTRVSVQSFTHSSDALTNLRSRPNMTSNDPPKTLRNFRMSVSGSGNHMRSSMGGRTMYVLHTLLPREVPPLSSRRPLIATAAATLFSIPSLPSFAATTQRPVGFVPISQTDTTRSALEAIETEFAPEFSSLLARFLINNEQVTRRWWEQKRREAASLAIAGVNPLEQYAGDLQEKYLVEMFSSLIFSVQVGLQKFKGSSGVAKLASLLARSYTSPTQKRLLAQLFSLVDSPNLQPTRMIEALLGEADDASVISLSLVGSGSKGMQGQKEQCCFGTAEPEVIVSPPPAANGRTSKLKPVMRATGQWTVQLVDGGLGYAEGETPTAALAQPSSLSGMFRPPAVAQAKTSNGTVSMVVLENNASRYIREYGTTSASIDMFIEPPNAKSLVARTARAELVPEYALVGFELVDGGSGYNADEPPTVLLKDRSDEIVEVAVTIAMQSVNAREDADKLLRPTSLRALEAELQAALPLSWEARHVSPMKEASVPTLPTLPSALVPLRDKKTNTYRLPIAVPSGAFGRRAKKPVEMQPPLSPPQLLKIFVAGGLCGSTAHTTLVPIDVVKTTLQQNGELYAGPVDCAKKIVAKNGPGSLFKGVEATIIGYAISGALSYGLVEVFSRAVRDAVGPGIALFFGSPLLIPASACSTTVVSLALCPFESVRVRSVKSGKPGLQVLQEVLAKDGLVGLYKGFPPIWLKEVPYVITKFVVFDIVSNRIVSIAQDTELLATPAIDAVIPLVAGALAGMAAAVVSQPADAVFTQVNSGLTLSSALDQVRKDPMLLVKSLPPRLLFCVMLVSLQFEIFTLLRSKFGVSKSDLTLVWDALAPLIN